MHKSFLSWSPLALPSCRERAGGAGINSYSVAYGPLRASVSSFVSVCVSAHRHFHDKGSELLGNVGTPGWGKESIPEIPQGAALPLVQIG